MLLSTAGLMAWIVKSLNKSLPALTANAMAAKVANAGNNLFIVLSMMAIESGAVSSIPFGSIFVPPLLPLFPVSQTPTKESQKASTRINSYIGSTSLSGYSHSISNDSFARFGLVLVRVSSLALSTFITPRVFILRVCSYKAAVR